MAEKRHFLRVAKILSTAFCFAVALFATPAFADDLCRNLFDSTKVSVGYVNSGNGTVGGAETYRASDFIPVVAGQKYYLGGNRFSGTNTGAFYKSDKTYLSGITANGIINVPQDAAYIRFTMQTTALGTVQLEKGSTATSYVPYNPLCATCQGIIKTYESATGTVSQNGTPTPTNPVEPTFYQQGDMILRKVGNYADSYDATTGKITRRVGVKVLDGTEAWGDDNGASYVYTDFPGRVGGSTVFLMSTHFSNNLIIKFMTTNVGFRKSVLESLNITGTVDGIKSYLAMQATAGTPVTVWYPLETPVEETVTSTTYCADAIKIATTAYNAARFSPVVNDLNSTVATIRDIVTNTINQTAAIASLQATKQTRPEDACPAGKKCLLVETEENGVVVPHWFPIIEAPE